MRKAILKDGHHAIDGDDDHNDLSFSHGDADQFDFQAFDQHQSHGEGDGKHHPVINDHAHIDYTVLDFITNNSFPEGINNLGEIATPFGLFDHDGHLVLPAGTSGIANIIGPGVALAPGTSGPMIISLDNAGDVVRWGEYVEYVTYGADGTTNGHLAWSPFVTYADGTNSPNIGPLQFTNGPAGEPVNMVQSDVYMNVNHEFAGSYVVGTSAGPKVIDQGVNGLTYEVRGFVQFGENGPAQDFMVPGSVQTWINGLNDHGDIAGNYRDAAGVTHAFLDQGGKITTLDFPSSLIVDGHEVQVNWSLNGLNNLDQLVGSVTEAYNYEQAQNEFGFVYDHGKFTFVNGPVAPNPTSGFSAGTTLTGINDHGTVVGYEVPSPITGAIVPFEAQIQQLQQATTPHEPQVSEDQSIYHQIVDHSNHS